MRQRLHHRKYQAVLLCQFKCREVLTLVQQQHQPSCMYFKVLRPPSRQPTDVFNKSSLRALLKFALRPTARWDFQAMMKVRQQPKERNMATYHLAHTEVCPCQN